MAIHYPEGGTLYQQCDASTPSTLMNDLASRMQTMGWTVTAQSGYTEFNFYVFSGGGPYNNQTATIDTVVYTFVTTLVNTTPRQVKIGANATENARNLMDAVNAGPGSGMEYSSSTTPHPTCTASQPSSQKCRITLIAPGPSAKTCSSAMNDVSVDSNVFRYGGYKCDTAMTSAGLQARLYMYSIDTQEVKLKASNVAETSNATSPVIARLGTTAGKRLECRCHRYGIWTWLYNSGANNDGFQFEVPYIREEAMAPAVAAVSASGGHWVITTDRPHKARNANRVYIAGATADGGTRPAAFNGFWKVTVVDDTSYVLDGSASGDDAWDAGSGKAALYEASEISECWYESANNFDHSGNNQWFRDTILFAYAGFAVLNDYKGINAIFIVSGVKAADAARYDNWGPYADLIEARVGWRPTGTDPAVKIGELWGAFIVVKPVPRDVIKTDFDGHDWIQITTMHRTVPSG